MADDGEIHKEDPCQPLDDQEDSGETEDSDPFSEEDDDANEQDDDVNEVNNDVNEVNDDVNEENNEVTDNGEEEQEGPQRVYFVNTSENNLLDALILRAYRAVGGTPQEFPDLFGDNNSDPGQNLNQELETQEQDSESLDLSNSLSDVTGNEE